jgi:hypothetical protein
MKLLLLVLLSMAATLAQAFELAGTHPIVLSNAQGEKQIIGTVSFTPQAGGRAAFKIAIDDKLGEFFLAMRPFRCLTGSRQRLCHFPVEREMPVISAEDLEPLEYALMFMRTAPTSLHVDPFNGIFYRLRMTSEGIQGRLHDLNMDPFITPDSVPPDRRRRPVRPADLSLGDESTHWLPYLRIE